MENYRARVIQDGQTVAQVFGSDFAATEREGTYYLWTYAQDGPAEMQIAEKRSGCWRFVSGTTISAMLLGRVSPEPDNPHKPR